MSVKTEGNNSSPAPKSRKPTYHGTPGRSGHPIKQTKVPPTTMPTPKKGS